MIGVAGVVSSFAQNVYSVNVVGYINLTQTNQWALISDQLDDGAGNQITNLFSAPMTGSYPVLFYKYNGVTYDQITRVNATTWSFNPNTLANRQATLKPGEAVFVKKTGNTPLTYTFVGEVMQGTLLNPVTPGFELYSTMVPQDGLIKTLHNFQPNRFDQVFFAFNGVTYSNRTWTGTAWSGTEPLIKVGEGFWINNRTNIVNQWTRSFTVN